MIEGTQLVDCARIKQVEGRCSEIQGQEKTGAWPMLLRKMVTMLLVDFKV